MPTRSRRLPRAKPDRYGVPIMANPQGDPVSPPIDPETALRRIATWDLPGAPPIELPEIDGFAAQLQQRRLSGVLLAAHNCGDVTLPDELRTEVIERQHAALLWCIELEVRLLEVRDAFDAAGGIEHLVIKGPAIAHLDNPDPSMRTFADVDVLVAGRDFDRAAGVLAAMGASAPWAERRAGFDRRFAKSKTMTFDDGIELDLHRTLADGAHGHRIPLGELFESTDSLWRIGCQAVLRLTWSVVAVEDGGWGRSPRVPAP